MIGETRRDGGVMERAGKLFGERHTELEKGESDRRGQKAMEERKGGGAPEGGDGQGRR